MQYKIDRYISIKLIVINIDHILVSVIEKVNTQITINKYNTISINLDNSQTDQDFNGQPIRGVVVDEFVYGFMHDKTKDKE